MEYVLKTNALTKSFKNHYALNKVSINVPKGSIYGLIGKNGAGKTTLMKIITGLSYQNSGTIELFESNDFSKGVLRIGSTIENPGLYLNMTARENLIAFGKVLGIHNKKDIDSILKIVGLENLDKKKTKNFSLGMKQRLAIGIALLGNPDFLILDEPINGLDPSGIKSIRELLLSLNIEKQVTIIISSHILGELSKIATHYGIINNGVLIGEFSNEELKNRCKKSLKLVVDNTEKAITILESKIGVEDYNVLPNNTIKIFDKINSSKEITLELCKNNVGVISIGIDGQDLEDYFMGLMEVKSNA